MFTEEIVKKKWEEAGGFCPCVDYQHPDAHPTTENPCGQKLEWDQRDKRPHDEYPGSWVAHQLASNRGWGEDNCMVHCLSCHLLGSVYLAQLGRMF